jgi:hypothetical protein
MDFDPARLLAEIVQERGVSCQELADHQRAGVENQTRLKPFETE